MKWKGFLIALALIASLLAGLLTSPMSAQAAEPPAYLTAMLKCSGLSLAQLEWAEQDFDTAYGWAHALTTEWQWRASYEARVNEFAHSLGCPQVLDEGQLTRWYRFYAPAYARILRNVPE